MYLHFGPILQNFMTTKFTSVSGNFEKKVVITDIRDIFMPVPFFTKRMYQKFCNSLVNVPKSLVTGCTKICDTPMHLSTPGGGAGLGCATLLFP